MIQLITEQKPIEIPIDPSFQNIGIKMSGGADSSLLAFILCKHLKNKVNFHAITLDNPLKPYQIEFATSVIDWLENTFNFKFASHTKKMASSEDDLVDEQELTLYHTYQKHNLDAHFIGVTANPLNYEENDILKKTWKYRDPERDPIEEYSEFDSYQLQDAVIFQKLGKPIPNSNITINGFAPFSNIDKKAIAELYQHYNLIDTLFPMTRSCEKETNYFLQHCGRCWWCGEREYGFGRLQ